MKLNALQPIVEHDGTMTQFFRTWTLQVSDAVGEGGFMLVSNIGTGANNYLQLSATPGTADGTKFLRDDGTWQSIPGGGDLLAANNLADVDSAATSRTNLDVDQAGTINITKAAVEGVLTGEISSHTHYPTLTGPDFTYTSGVLTRIDYDDGSYKTLSYDVSDRLDTVDHVDGGTTVRKEFFYGVGGELDYITQTTL